MATGVFTPYSTVAPFFGAKPSWVPLEDQERILSYQIYEEIYWNHPETFKLMLRGSEGRPLYIPSGRIIVETMNRYTSTGLNFSFISANEAQALEAQAFFSNFLARERFRSRFASAKRYGLIRGDWLFHVTANPLKAQGARVSVKAVDPAAYFPVYSDDDPDLLVKVHLAEQFVVGDKTFVRRQTYERDESGRIISSLTLWEPDKWTAVDAAPVQVFQPPTMLDPRITALPVYHIKNFDEDGNPFGSSEMRGLERLMAGINQAISDEDIALALEGLGIYKTAGGPPVNPETGEETDWIIGPGRVMEDESFARVPGIGSVTPFLDHVDKIWEFTQMAAGSSAAAVGKVDVQVAESGVALAMQMGPIMARAAEKDEQHADVLRQMFYDLRTMWFPVFESVQFPDVSIEPEFRNPLPVNEAAEITNVVSLVTEGIMSKTTARENLALKGIKFAPDELERLAQEAQMASDLSASDPFAARVDAELAATQGDQAQ